MALRNAIGYNLAVSLLQVHVAIAIDMLETHLDNNNSKDRPKELSLHRSTLQDFVLGPCEFCFDPVILQSFCCQHLQHA